MLLVDDPPGKDTYTITVRTRLRNITGFELETLTDPSLPGNGPGRGDAQRPNFVLNTFAVAVAPTGGKAAAKAVKFRNRPAQLLAKGLRRRRRHRRRREDRLGHQSRVPQAPLGPVRGESPLGFEEGTTCTFTLVQQFGAGRTIGRLRLSALTGDLKRRPLPAELAAILAIPAAERTVVQTRKLLDYRLEHDAEAESAQGPAGRGGASDAVRSSR